MNIKEWLPVENESLFPPSHKVVKVKRANGDEIKAYFWKDQFFMLTHYFDYKPTYFQQFHGEGKWRERPFLYDVTHWRYLK